MKIKNYDTLTSKKKDKRLFDWYPQIHRSLIRGASNTGKTNLLIEMLLKPILFYDKLHVYTKNPFQDKYKYLQKVMKDISMKVGYNVLEVNGPNEIKKVDDYPENNTKVCIFDDLLCEDNKVQKRIEDYFILGRHKNICPIYLSQSYFSIPKDIRLNCDKMCFFNVTTNGELNLVSKENMINKDLFKKLKPFDFIFLDKNTKRIKKNFDEDVM